MENPKKYGNAPFRIALLHGGPGAPGSMAQVARELSARRGVLEPLQTEASLEGQVQELRELLEENADPPVILIGSSWGAMLGFIFSSRYPELTSKLILVGSGVYETGYASVINETRLSRLNEEERVEVRVLEKAMETSPPDKKDRLLARFGALCARSDAFDPLTLDMEILEYQAAVHEGVWGDLEKMRETGELLELGRKIRCPVVAIHGDYDPHPADGVRKPLESVLGDFRFILLRNCGHIPWIERQARDEFYRIIEKEME